MLVFAVIVICIILYVIVVSVMIIFCNYYYAGFVVSLCRSIFVMCRDNYIFYGIGMFMLNQHSAV